jgi:hypothetical protein
MRAQPGKWTAEICAVAVGWGLLMLPAAWTLRDSSLAAPDGIETVDDAVVACRRSGLSGWPLVAFAQQLVYRKFRYYSCRNLWDSPAQAFRRGMGYCTQYNLALKQILYALAIETRAVFSLRVRVVDEPEWSMGHTWLRVCIDGEVRDVCAGHPDNLPGSVNFTPLAPVWLGSMPVLFLAHLGMIPFCGILEWRSVLSRQPIPQWMFQARKVTRRSYLEPSPSRTQ